MKIYKKLQRRVAKVKSLLSVGLDSNIDRFPSRFLSKKQPQFEFNKWIIDQTQQFVCAYKPNLAFYEARGSKGWQELKLTMDYLQNNFPDIITICDAKRADIGSTNQAYVEAIFDGLGFDAITLHPYLGQEALEPFLKRDDKACIILCKTSNPGGGELQDLMVVDPGKKLSKTQQIPVWQHLAQQVATSWNGNNNCMLVVGATYPEQLKEVRSIVGEMPILVPGIGAQGGDLEQVLANGLNAEKQGLIINSSRGIIFAKDPGQAIKDLLSQAG